MDETSTEPILQCPTCRSALSVNEEIDDLEENCPVCGSEIRLRVFSRLYREPAEKVLPKLADESDARCNFYPELTAEKVCDECGCFLSDRAAVDWGGLDLCLPCLHRLREEQSSAQFVARAKLHENRALALVTLLAPFTLFTAPIAIFLLLRYRKAPGGFEPRSRLRWWLAMVLSIAWLAVWGVLIVVWMSLILEDFA